MAAERIQPALSSIGQGLGGAQVLNPTDPRRPNVPNQAVADFKKRAAEEGKSKEVDLEKLKKMQEAREGIYNINNEYKDGLIEDEYYKRTVEGGEDPNKVINDITTELQRVNKTETELIQPFIKEATKVGENGERVMIYDDEGKFVPPDEALTFLTSSLQDSPEAQEAKEKRVYNTWLQQKIADLRKRSLKYDPSFSLGNEMLTEFKKFSTLPGVSDQTDVGAAFEELNEGANLSTVLESRPDLREAFMNHLGSRTDIVPKWASNYAVTTGMSPYTLKSGEGEFMGLAMDAMMEEAENVFLPAPQQTRRMSVSQKRAGDGAAAVNAAISEPAPLDAPVMIDGTPTTAYGVSVNVDEDMPLRVEGKETLGRPRFLRKVGPEEYELEIAEYQKVDEGASPEEINQLDAVGKLVYYLEDGKRQPYRLDKSNIKRVKLKEGDLNWNSMESLIAKTSKAQGVDVKNRLNKLTEIEMGGGQEDTAEETTETIKVSGTPDIKSWEPSKQYEYNNSIYFYDNDSKQWKKKTKS